MALISLDGQVLSDEAIRVAIEALRAYEYRPRYDSHKTNVARAVKAFLIDLLEEPAPMEDALSEVTDWADGELQITHAQWWAMSKEERREFGKAHVYLVCSCGCPNPKGACWSVAPPRPGCAKRCSC